MWHGHHFFNFKFLFLLRVCAKGAETTADDSCFTIYEFHLPNSQNTVKLLFFWGGGDVSIFFLNVVLKCQKVVFSDTWPYIMDVCVITLLTVVRTESLMVRDKVWFLKKNFNQKAQVSFVEFSVRRCVVYVQKYVFFSRMFKQKPNKDE